MICNEFKCVFVHIPKTGGQSIEHFFLNLLGLTWKQREHLLLRYNDDPRQGPERLAHLTASEYISCGHMSVEKFNSFFKFSFVRNPWSRLVSEYLFCGHIRRFCFKDFVFYNLPEAGMTDAYRHIMPQYDFLYDSEGRLLVDFVGRFENLQADFNLICEKLGMQKSKLPHVNASTRKHSNPWGIIIECLSKTKFRQEKHEHYADYYDDETREFVSIMYKKDIETFGYTFGEGQVHKSTVRYK